MTSSKITSTDIIVTGAAGFIGFHLSKRLLIEGYKVVGIDNLNEYYDVQLKSDRLTQLKGKKGFSFHPLDIADRRSLELLFETHGRGTVVHLAAQAGVRHSLDNPQAYVESNLVGFANILEVCRHFGTDHLVFASSSSVYGANTKIPFSESDTVDHPVSLYAATKKSNEILAHAYAHLYELPVTGLRFFTVYGPWGRPDMAYFLFANAIRKGEHIRIFNNGRMRRDFTYIDDVVEGIIRVISHRPEPDAGWSGHQPNPATSYAPYRIYNIGNNQPVELMRFIEALEVALGQTAKKKFMPMQPGDVLETYANIDELASAVGYRPTTPIEEGLRQFVEWYDEYYAGEDGRLSATQLAS